ncbi:MAG: methyl-accepting chemotaxis protein [Deltaproteobacteria bacterium]|nr:methyl-accepting chemotaxis protein [Deltaproteobacteria bacterium]
MEQEVARGRPISGGWQRAVSAVQQPQRERAGGIYASLNFKILAGYVILGLALFAILRLTGQSEIWLQLIAVEMGALIGGLFTSLAIARINRIQALNRSALEISRGDLSKAVTAAASVARDEIDDLTVAIAQMQENLRDLVGHVQRTARSVADSASDVQRAAEGVNASTEETATSVEKIAGGATNQTQLVERASKVIGEIAESIQRTAKSADDAQKSSTETASAAEFSSNAAKTAGTKVKKVFDRIESASTQVVAFGEKTQEITKIVDAITQVAQQTNLLALNATIEAARAGEYGRGFAVVAEEVRKLAESSGRQAEQISRLARDINAQSVSVVTAMKEGTEELGQGREDLNSIIRALDSITDTARRGTEKVNAISDAAREQLKGSQEMVTVFEKISQVARDNASSTDKVRAETREQTDAVAQMNSSASELINLSDELKTVVSRFKLGS